MYQSDVLVDKWQIFVFSATKFPCFANHNSRAPRTERDGACQHGRAARGGKDTRYVPPAGNT